MNSTLRRAGVMGVGFALIVICAGIGAFYLAAAANAWLATMMQPGWAMLIVAFALILPLIVFAIAAWLMAGAERRAQAHAALTAHVGEIHEPESLKHFALHAAKQLFRERPMTAVGIALAIGAVAVRYPGAAAMVARKLIAFRI